MIYYEFTNAPSWNNECVHSPCEHPGTCWISGHCVIMLSFQGERVSESHPCRSEPRVHKGRFTIGVYRPLTDHRLSKNGFTLKTYLKYCLAWGHFCPLRYQTPTAYQLIGFSGSRSTISWARMNNLEWRWERWYMQAMCSGIVWLWIWTSPRILKRCYIHGRDRISKRRTTDLEVMVKQSANWKLA